MKVTAYIHKGVVLDLYESWDHAQKRAMQTWPELIPSDVLDIGGVWRTQYFFEKGAPVDAAPKLQLKELEVIPDVKSSPEVHDRADQGAQAEAGSADCVSLRPRVE